METCSETKWQKAQTIEAAYWEKHLDVELVKQDGYMKMMKFDPTANHAERSYLDLGGGPRSVLLRVQGAVRRTVVDPIKSLDAAGVYGKSGIDFCNVKAEEFHDKDEYTDVLVYNVLQHVLAPEKVLEVAWNALKVGGTLRVCEFLGVPIGMEGTDYFDCHPHVVTEEWLLPALRALPGAKITRADKFDEPAKFLGQTWIATDVVKEHTTDDTGLQPRRHHLKAARRVMRFHILGLPHVKTTTDFVACAFTMKVWNMCRMLKALGHEVIHYGTEGSNPVCDEHVDIVPDSMHQEFYSKWNWRERLFPGYDTHGKHFWDHAAQVTPAKLKARIRGRGHHDLILSTFGSAQKYQVGDVDERLHGNSGPKVIEMGVGYKGVWADFKVFESHCWMHFVYGWTTKQTEGTPFDTVIPNYYDPDMFEFRDRADKEDYALFVARNTYDKGLMDAVEATKAVGMKLKVAGQRLGPNGGLMVPQAYEYPHVEYIGYLDVNTRSEVMSRAKVLMMPTKYIEPFGGVVVEAQMCFPADVRVVAEDIERVYAHKHTGLLLTVCTDDNAVQCTPEHPFLTQRGWVPAKDLTLDDYLVRRRTNVGDSVDTERLGDIVSRLSADGAAGDGQGAWEVGQRRSIKSEKAEAHQRELQAVHFNGRGYDSEILPGGGRFGREPEDRSHSYVDYEKSRFDGCEVDTLGQGIYAGRGTCAQTRVPVCRAGGTWSAPKSNTEVYMDQSQQIGIAALNRRARGVPSSHHGQNRTGLLRGLNRRGGNHIAKALWWWAQAQQDSVRCGLQYRRQHHQLDNESHLNPQFGRWHKARSWGRVCQGELVERYAGVSPRVQLPPPLQSTVTVSRFEETAHGASHRMGVFAPETATRRQTDTTHESVGADASLYEHTRIRAIAKREVRDLPVYNLGTRTGVYEANGLIVHNCGTPVISTDWGAYSETCVHGLTGWRCRTMPDFIEALERIDEIDPKVCRSWAINNFSLEVAAKKYEDYYQRVSGVRIGKRGWYDPGAYGLDPWSKRYPS